MNTPFSFSSSSAAGPSKSGEAGGFSSFGSISFSSDQPMTTGAAWLALGGLVAVGVYLWRKG